MSFGQYPIKSASAGTGTVTSVGLADGSTIPIYVISNSPVTTSGTLTFTLTTQTANKVFASATSGGAAQPGFRTLVAADLPTGNLTDAGTDGITVTSGTGAVIGSGTSIAQHVADATHNGYLSSADWVTFNAKQAALTIGNLTDTGTDGIVVTGGTGSVIGTGTSLAQHVADATHNGYLSQTDWSTFNSKQSALTFSQSLTNSAGTVTLTNDAASPGNSKFYGTDSGGTRGWQSSLAGTVTSVALSVPAASIFGVTGSPVTSSGTLGLTTAGTSGGIPYFSSTSALSSSGALTASQLVLGGGAGATPTSLAAGSQFQVLVMGASNPGYGQVNLGQSAAITGTLPIGNGGTNITTYTTGDILYASATNVLSKLAAGSSGQILTQGASVQSWAWPMATVNAKTGNYTLTNTDDLVTGDSSGGTFTLTLPTAAGITGKRFTVKKIDTSLTKISLASTSSQTIDGNTATTYELSVPGEFWTFESDGSNWLVVNHRSESDWVTYSATFTGLGTIASQAMQWRKLGDSIQFRGTVTIGTPTATEARCSLPFTSDGSSKIAVLELGAPVSRNFSSTTYFSAYSLYERSQAYITFGFQTSSVNAEAKQLGNAIFNAGEILFISAVTIPIVGWRS